MIDLDTDSDQENIAYQAETLAIAPRKRAKVESPLAGGAHGSGGPQVSSNRVTQIPDLSSTRRVTSQTDVSSGSIRDVPIRGGDDVQNAPPIDDQSDNGRIQTSIGELFRAMISSLVSIELSPIRY